MSDPTPVVFIHGLWLHQSSWFPWMEAFAEAGYQPFAPGWPGEADTVEETRAHPERQAGCGIEDVAGHYAKILADIGRPAVLVGHSFGGMIVEKLLGEGIGAAGIAIDAAQIKGVLPLPLSALRATFPVLKKPSNKGKALSLTSEQFHYGFGNAIPQDESDELYEQWNIPSPIRPLFQAAAANFSLHSEAKVDTKNANRGPLLLIAGGQDHTVPEVITKSTLKQYRHSEATTELVGFPDRGHSLVIDQGWQEVAQAGLGWLEKQSIS